MRTFNTSSLASRAAARPATVACKAFSATQARKCAQSLLLATAAAGVLTLAPADRAEAISGGKESVGIFKPLDDQDLSGEFATQSAGVPLDAQFDLQLRHYHSWCFCAFRLCMQQRTSMMQRSARGRTKWWPHDSVKITCRSHACRQGLAEAQLCQSVAAARPL